MVGTWNLAGGEHLDQLTPAMLQQWLIDPSEKHGQLADIIVCGFQETVDLTAANMLSTDPRNKMQLELLLTQAFSNVSGYDNSDPSLTHLSHHLRYHLGLFLAHFPALRHPTRAM